MTPWEILAEWLPANSEPERPQMTLSTVNEEGAPDARTVLLTEYDEHGFYFHTDSRSRKVADIAANPRVVLSILWPGFTKQLVIQGAAEVAPPVEQALAYENRSPYLRQLAWLNTAEMAQLPLSERRAQWAAFPPAQEPPPTWIGFLVRPTRFTFWGSNPDAPSRREEYTLVDGAWTLEYLPG